MQTAYQKLLTDLGLRLRPGCLQDAEGLHALVTGILESYGLPAGTVKDGDLNDVATWYGSRNGVFEILEDSQGALIGCCGAFARSAVVCELRRLYLAHKLRHRGLGGVFMDRVLEWARSRGFDSMELSTAPVLKAAVSLYQKYGFMRVSETTGESTSPCNLHLRLQLSHTKLDGSRRHYHGV
ncbi:MAG: GNAT family N-acetyltransferase [Gammaproteobacteria bacterium]